MDQPPAVALTAFIDALPRAIETEIGAALCAIGAGRTLTFFDPHCPTVEESRISEMRKEPTGCAMKDGRGNIYTVMQNAQIKPRRLHRDSFMV